MTMDEVSTQQVPGFVAKKKRVRKSKAFWKRIREPLAKSRFVKGMLSLLLAWGLRFVRLTNPLVKGSVRILGGPMPIANRSSWRSGMASTCWHPCSTPGAAPGRDGVAQRRRRAQRRRAGALRHRDRARFRRPRGRPQDRQGRGEGAHCLEKGAWRWQQCLHDRRYPHGTPREAGQGIVLLAKLSGRPILPVAFTTSRRKVLEKSWDKTTINLPFGRGSTVVGQPIEVPADADEAMLEAKRQELTEALNAATGQAYRMVDDPR